MIAPDMTHDVTHDSTSDGVQRGAGLSRPDLAPDADEGVRCAIRPAGAEGPLQAWLDAHGRRVQLLVVGFETPEAALAQAAARGLDAQAAVAAWRADADAAIAFALRAPNRLVLVETTAAEHAGAPTTGEAGAAAADARAKLGWRLNALRQRALKSAAGAPSASPPALGRELFSGLSEAFAETERPTLAELERLFTAAAEADARWTVVAEAVRDAALETRTTLEAAAEDRARLLAEVETLRSALALVAEEHAAIADLQPTPAAGPASMAHPIEAAPPGVPALQPQQAELAAPAKSKSGIATRFMQYWLVARSPLFDFEWYLARYPDVTGGKREAIMHYLRYGGFEGRAAGPQFCSLQYLNAYADVREAKINPLVHYLRAGEAEQRMTFPALAVAD